jgi:two-component system sensor histidine kinase PhoQ
VRGSGETAGAEPGPQSSQRPRSLQKRLILSATIGLAFFLAIAGWVLDRAYRDSVNAAGYDRLRGHVYMLLGAAVVNAEGLLSMPETLPDPRLSAPTSGLYAQVVDGEGKLVWKSKSLLWFSLEPVTAAKAGDFDRDRITLIDGTRLDQVTYGVIWELPGGAEHRYTVQVAEDLSGYRAQVKRFRRSLTLWFSAIVVAALFVQVWILRRGLSPIRDVAHEIHGIESGAKDRITGQYPAELQALTTNLNALILAAEGRLTRYRNALGDLAHSLKTPLAVMRNSVDAASPQGRQLLDELDRLDATIEYQLKKAAAAGTAVLMQPVLVAPMLDRLASSLRKVYAERRLNLVVSVTPGLRFYGDQGDLYEIAGNIIDNACKWARSRIAVRAEAGKGIGRRPSLHLCVQDDGPGIPAHAIGEVMERGTRADQRVPGHGIGLAVVRELVEEVYRGELRIESTERGTMVSVTIPFA